MANCGNCCGSCGSCSGAMELTSGEVRMLLTLGQIPFLPVARKMGDDVPVYLEDDACTREEYSLILQCLEKRGLISIDYDKPGKLCPHRAGTAGCGTAGNAGNRIKNLAPAYFCA